MRILISFALENEFASWRALRKFRAAKWGEVDVFLSDMTGCEVAVILTGAGPRPAALEISRVIRQESDFAGMCISAGLAGALQPEYRIAQILAARVVVSGELPEAEGAERSQGAQRAEGTSPLSSMESSGALISFANASGATVVERFYTAGRVIGNAEEKQYLSGVADAIEMESFEILRGAASVGIPAVAIRAVSDASDESLPFDMNSVFTEEGRVSIPRVIGQVAQRPQSLPGLVRLGKNSRAASEALAQFLESYVGVLVNRTGHLSDRAVKAAR